MPTEAEIPVQNWHVSDCITVASKVLCLGSLFVTCRGADIRLDENAITEHLAEHYIWLKTRIFNRIWDDNLRG